jgi:hypothetical protein
LWYLIFKAFKYIASGELAYANPDMFLRAMVDQLLERRSIDLYIILAGLTFAADVSSKDRRRFTIGISHWLAWLFRWSSHPSSEWNSLWARRSECRISDQESLGTENCEGRVLCDLEWCSKALHRRDTAKSIEKKEAEEKASGETKSLLTRRFLKHVTGFGFINRNMPSITIVFSAHMGDKYRPVAHTCEQDLDIPCGAYDYDEKILEDYLEEAFLQSAVQGITTS